jgi:hypothetical protein
VRLERKQVVFLRMLALKTWSFFDHVVGREDNWLPPDNVQENPDVVAHRTSPTNMGLSLLANLAAHDFGYLSTERLIARTASTFATMQRMERYRGHFFNWYDTRTLEPLPPRYVSTVDSSNLAGHLLTLQPGLRGLADQKIFPRAGWTPSPTRSRCCASSRMTVRCPDWSSREIAGDRSGQSADDPRSRARLPAPFGGARGGERRRFASG